MRQSAWKDKQQREETHKQKIRWEFLALILVCTVLGGGFFLFKPSEKHLANNKPSVSTINQLLQNSVQTSSVTRKIPTNYKTQGTVDDRYTLAQDPESGEFILNDAMGGIGTNNTSIDGDRMRLAKEMVELEQYTNQNRGKLNPAAYEWLKKVTRAGMKLAFGTPGVPAYAQPGIKKEILTEFHNISANPERSFMLTSKYLELEKVVESPEKAYLAGKDTNNSNYFRYDPLSQPLLLTKLSLQSHQLSSVLTTTDRYPTMDKLTTPDSPYAYTTYTNSVLTASRTTSPTYTTSTSTPSTTMSPTYTSSISTLDPKLSTTISPTYTSLTTSTLDPRLSTTISPTYTSTTTTLDPTISTTISPTYTSSITRLDPTISTTTSPTYIPSETPTVSEYYESVLGPHQSPSTRLPGAMSPSPTPMPTP